MGDLKIQPVVVKARTGRIKKNIQSDILDKNRNTVKKLKQYMKESKGETVTVLKSYLDKEEKLVDGIGCILKEMADYINMACDDFEQLDQRYASEKVQK